MASLMDYLVSSTRFCCFVTAGDFTDGGDAKPGDFRDVRGLRQGAGEDAVSTDLIGAGDVVESTERLTLVGTGATLSSSLDVAEKPVGRPDDGVRVGSPTLMWRSCRAKAPTFSTSNSWGLSDEAARFARPAKARNASSAASGRAVR